MRSMRGGFICVWESLYPAQDSAARIVIIKTECKHHHDARRHVWECPGEYDGHGDDHKMFLSSTMIK
jgi:hypothetical protein